MCLLFNWLGHRSRPSCLKMEKVDMVMTHDMAPKGMMYFVRQKVLSRCMSKFGKIRHTASCSTSRRGSSSLRCARAWRGRQGPGGVVHSTISCIYLYIWIIQILHWFVVVWFVCQQSSGKVNSGHLCKNLDSVLCFQFFIEPGFHAAFWPR